MADVLGTEIPVNLPDFTFGIDPAVFLLILVIVFTLAGGGVGFFLLHRFKVYRYKVVVFENVSGNAYQPVFKDRARLVKIGEGGEEALYLLKKKVFRTAYGRKMGVNTYWFAVGQDGYWYNFVLGDLDAKLGMLDIEPVDRDLRAAYVWLQKNIKDRYKRRKVITPTAIVIAGIVIVSLILVIGGWYIIDKLGETIAATSGNIEASTKLVEAAEKVVGAIDNLNQGGSGLKDAR